MAALPLNITDDLCVIIPYSRLCDLLSASQAVSDMTLKISRLEAQVDALRGLNLECMTKISDLQKMV